MTTANSILKRLLRASGFSQRELARRSSMSNATLVAYAKERQDPGLSTLQRLAEAAGCDLHIEVRPRLTPSEERTLEFHRRIADKLVQDPERTLSIARRNLDLMRANDDGGHAGLYLDAWQLLLDGMRQNLERILVSTDAIAKDLRQTTPFSGVLSDDERLEVLMRTDGARIARATGQTYESARADLLAKISASAKNLRDESLVGV